MATKTLTQTSTFLSPIGALFMAGYSFAASQNTSKHTPFPSHQLSHLTNYISVPHLYTSPPQISIPLFTKVFYTGARIGIPLSALSGLASLYLAYMCKSPSQRRLFVIAGVVVLATGPWTAGVMGPGIRRLIEIGESSAEMAKSEQTGDCLELLKGWVWGNHCRTAMYLFGGCVGLWGVVFG